VSFATADLSDQYPESVQVAHPLFREFGGVPRFSGAILTLRVFEDNALVQRSLATGGAGRVLVIDGGGSLRCALLGGRLAGLARDNGWAGLLINGCVRDSNELRQVSIGIRALAVVPRRPSKAGTGEEGIQVSFAGVDFVPGHYLYADEDGVLVAPRNLLQ